jgi:hypothetical protein
MVRLAVATVLVSGLAAAAGSAQTCGVPARFMVGVESGLARHAASGGVDGAEWGAVASAGSRGLSLEMAVQRTALGGAESTPHAGRVTLRHSVASLRNWEICVAGHGGASWYGADTGSGRVVAGGAGIRAGRPVAAGATGIIPHVEARGLVARADGTVFDIDVEGAGLSLGVEAGVTGHFRRALARATASADGFAAGLGVTPYPAVAVRLSVGYRF